MNVLAKWIWIIIMFPIRAFIGLCIAISKHMPEKVEVPYEIRKKDNVIIPIDSGNRDYQQFVEDVVGIGTSCVEGADYVGVTSYTDARRAEYPPLEDQLDKIYHSGLNAWKADIKAIKDKYPKTQVGITSIASLPDWVIGIST